MSSYVRPVLVPVKGKPAKGTPEIGSVTTPTETIGVTTPEEAVERGKNLGKPLLPPSGGGGPASTPTQTAQPTGPSQEELRRIEQQIESKRREELAEANKQYRESLRNIRDIQGRQEAFNKLNENIARITQNYQLERVSKGVVISGELSGQRIRQEEAVSLEKVSKGRGSELTEEQLTTLERKGLITLERKKEDIIKQEQAPYQKLVLNIKEKIEPIKEKIEPIKKAYREIKEPKITPERAVIELQSGREIIFTPEGIRRGEFTFVKEAKQSTGEIAFNLFKLPTTLAEAVTAKIPDYDVPNTLTVKSQIYPTKSTQISSGSFNPYKTEEFMVKPLLTGQQLKTGIIAGASLVPYFIAPEYQLGLGALILQTPEKTPEMKQAGTSLLISGGTILAIKGVTKPFTPKVRTETQLGRNLLIERQTVISMGDKSRTITEYKLIQTPTQVTYTKTTPIREFFGIKPIEKVTLTSRPSILKTIAPSYVDEAYFALQKQVPTRTGDILKISGTQSAITSKEVSLGTKRVQMLGTRYAEAFKTGGRPIQASKITKYLPEDLYLAYPESQAQFRLTFKGQEAKLTFPQAGKTKTAQELLYSSELVGRKGNIEVFKVRGVSKDITKPLARATGRTTPFEGRVIREVIEIPEPERVIDKIIEKGSQQRQVLNLGQPKIFIQTIPEVKIPKAPKTFNLKSDYFASQAPRIVGGTGISRSAYESVGTVQSNDMNVIVRDLDIQKISPVIRSLQTEKPLVSLGSAGKQINILKDTQIVKTIPQQAERVRQKEITKRITKLLQAQKLSQQQKIKQASELLSKTKQTIKITPIRRVPRISTKDKGILTSVKEIKPLPQAFEVQIRRKGIFTTIGKGLPLGRALKLGAEKVKKTLAATFRLKEKGTTTLPDITYNLQTEIFTTPKRPTTNIEYVEKLGKRLKTGTEVSEIQYFKKIKGGKKKIFSI